MTHIKQGEYYLVTTDGWFIAPDGQQYRSVWGKCHIKTTEEILGFTPQRPSTNWFLCVGNAILAGCQVHYIIKCDEVSTVDNFYIYADTKELVGRIYISE